LLKDGRQATRKAKQAQMWCRTRPYKAKIKYRNTFLGARISDNQNWEKQTICKQKAQIIVENIKANFHLTQLENFSLI